MRTKQYTFAQCDFSFLIEIIDKFIMLIYFL